MQKDVSSSFEWRIRPRNSLKCNGQANSGHQNIVRPKTDHHAGLVWKRKLIWVQNVGFLHEDIANCKKITYTCNISVFYIHM